MPRKTCQTRAHRLRIGLQTEPFFGDTFVTTAFVVGIRRRFPTARITARVDNDLQRRLLSRHPHLDGLSATLRRQDVDIWFDFCRIPTVWYDEKLFPAEEAAARTRRQILHGMETGSPVRTAEGREAGRWVLTSILDAFALGRVQITCLLTGLQADISDAWIYVSAAEQRWADEVAARGPFVTVYSGTGNRTKCWPLGYWRSVIRYLRDEGFAVYQLGVLSDLPIEGASELLGKTTVGQAAALVRRSSLHVGIEGSITHVAASCRVPAVVLFGPTPVGVYGYGHHVNLVSTACHNCWDLTPDADWVCARNLGNECMTSIKPTMVRDAIKRALSGTPAAARGQA